MSNSTKTAEKSFFARNAPLFRRFLVSFILLVGLMVVWEALKWFAGDPWRPENNPFGITHQPVWRVKYFSDLNLPHLWDIFAAFGDESRRNGPPLIQTLAIASVYTFREAFSGFVLGGLLGFVLGALFAHLTLLERGCMPYVVASQTVPILAIAPMIIIWLGQDWGSVAVISAYLTFFPVTVSTLRGLRSPNPVAVELMRSYASTTWETLWKLRFPAALPYIFTALKVSATASVVGAIIGELPSGIREGLGGAILNFNSYYATKPSRLWAAIIVSAFLGIIFFLTVSLVEYLVLKNRHRTAESR
jgi:NitT/TauT family transport system permease protein